MNTIVTLNITIIRFAMYASSRCRIRVDTISTPQFVTLFLAQRCRTIRQERDASLTRAPDQTAVRSKDGDLLLLDDARDRP